MRCCWRTTRSPSICHLCWERARPKSIKRLDEWRTLFRCDDVRRTAKHTCVEEGWNDEWEILMRSHSIWNRIRRVSADILFYFAGVSMNVERKMKMLLPIVCSGWARWTYKWHGKEGADWIEWKRKSRKLVLARNRIGRIRCMHSRHKEKGWIDERDGCVVASNCRAQRVVISFRINE